MLGTLKSTVVQSPLKLFQILFRAWVPGNYSSWSTYRLAKTNLFRIINVANYVVLTLTRAKGGKTPVLGGGSFEEWVFIRSIQGHIGNQYNRNSRRTTRFTVVSSTGRFAYELESIRLRLICQFAYILKHVLRQLIHLLYVRFWSDASQSNQFPERDS